MIRLGFIGTGFVAQQCHLPSFDSIPECEIVAISDLHQDLADKIGRRYEIPRVYYSHQDLLNDNEIDAVVITVPRPLTSGLCLDSLNAGKKVFTEKPVALNSTTGEKILEVSQARKLPVQVGYMRRCDSSALLALRYLNDLKTLGQQPLLVRAYCYMGDSYCSPFGDFKPSENVKKVMSNVETMPFWLSDNDLFAYETYLNVFSHTLDLISFLLGSQLLVKETAIDAKAQGIILLQSNNGVAVELSTARCSLNQWLEGISFVFSDQVIDLSLPPAFLRNVPGTLTIRKGDYEDIVQQNRPIWSWAFRNQAAKFIEVCKDWPNTNTNLSAAVDQVRLVESIFR